MDFLESRACTAPSKETPSKDHPSQKRFFAYGRVENYIRHMNNIFDSSVLPSGEIDKVVSLTQEFKSSQPKPNSPIPPSFFPKSRVSRELKDKITMIHAYNNPSQSAPATKREVIEIATPHKRREGDKEVLGFQYCGFVDRLNYNLDRVANQARFSLPFDEMIERKVNKKNNLYTQWKIKREAELISKNSYRKNKRNSLDFKQPIRNVEIKIPTKKTFLDNLQRTFPLYKQLYSISRDRNGRDTRFSDAFTVKQVSIAGRSLNK